MQYGNLIRQPGVQGEKGAAGERGPQGDAGRDGRDGHDGRQGERGEAGQAGQEGAPGEKGEPGVPGLAGYPGRACGLYRAGEAYRALDVVAFQGCEWRAVVDEPGPLPGAGWVLGAAKGSRGRQGEPGPRGERGPQGEPGLGIVDAKVVEFEIILFRSDGAKFACNLMPLFERYHREAAA